MRIFGVTSGIDDTGATDGRGGVFLNESKLRGGRLILSQHIRNQRALQIYKLEDTKISEYKLHSRLCAYSRKKKKKKEKHRRSKEKNRIRYIKFN